MLNITKMQEKRPVYDVLEVDYEKLKNDSLYRDDVSDFIKSDSGFELRETGELFFRYVLNNTYQEVSPKYLRRAPSGRVFALDSLDTMETPFNQKDV